MIAEASHAAVSPEGLAIEAKDVPDAQNIIADWLGDIGISGLYEENETAILFRAPWRIWGSTISYSSAMLVGRSTEDCQHLHGKL